MVQREQEKLRRNLAKYNNFVREKESKVNAKYWEILHNKKNQILPRSPRGSASSPRSATTRGPSRGSSATGGSR